MKDGNIARWGEFVEEFYDNWKWNEKKTTEKVKRENYTFEGEFYNALKKLQKK